MAVQLQYVKTLTGLFDGDYHGFDGCSFNPDIVALYKYKGTWGGEVRCVRYNIRSEAVESMSTYNINSPPGYSSFGILNNKSSRIYTGVFSNPALHKSYVAVENKLTAVSEVVLCSTVNINYDVLAFDVYGIMAYIAFFSSELSNNLYLIKTNLSSGESSRQVLSGPSVDTVSPFAAGISLKYGLLYVSAHVRIGSNAFFCILVINTVNLTWEIKVTTTGYMYNSIDVSDCGEYVLIGYNHQCSLYDAKTFTLLSNEYGGGSDYVFKFCGAYDTHVISDTGKLYTTGIPVSKRVKWRSDPGLFPWTEPDGSVNCDTLFTLWDLHEETT